MTPDDYLGPEAAARLEIDAMLIASGWVVQDFKKIALGVNRGVAIRSVPMAQATAQRTICCSSTVAQLG